MFALVAPFKDVCHSNVDTANYRVGNMKVGGNGGVVSQPPAPFLLSAHCEIFISRCRTILPASTPRQLSSRWPCAPGRASRLGWSPRSSPFPSARVGDGWGPRGGGRPRRSLLTSRGPGCQRHVMFGGGGLSTFTFGGGEHPDSQKRKTNRRGRLKHARGYLPPELRLGGGRNTQIRFSSWKTSKTI